MRTRITLSVFVVSLVVAFGFAQSRPGEIRGIVADEVGTAIRWRAGHADRPRAAFDDDRQKRSVRISESASWFLRSPVSTGRIPDFTCEGQCLHSRGTAENDDERAQQLPCKRSRRS